MVHSSITLKAYQSVVESSESGAHARTKATFRYTLHKDENVTRAQEESVRPLFCNVIARYLPCVIGVCIVKESNERIYSRFFFV